MTEVRRLRKQGLYDPRFEHDACGVGFVANIKGAQSHDIVQKGLQVLQNLTHRGACGCDPLTGDGAGILLQVPHAFLKKECQALRIQLPDAGGYGVGMVFEDRAAGSVAGVLLDALQSCERLGAAARQIAPRVGEETSCRRFIEGMIALSQTACAIRSATK